MVTVLVFALPFPIGDWARADDVAHSFLACGSKTYIIDSSGKKIWTYPASTRDGYILSDGSILLTLSKSRAYPGGAVVRVERNGEDTEQLIWRGTQSEVNSAQPTADGTFVLTEAGPKPRLVEIKLDGTILTEFPLKCQTKNHHMQTRMARKLVDGTYLVPHLLDFAVIHYSQSGKELGRLDTTLKSDPDRKVHTWPFTAIRHGEGHTLVCCTNGNRVVDFDATGQVAWTLTNEDLPGAWLQDPCGAQVLPNGNIVITAYAAGRVDPNAPKIFEVTREKGVVWKHVDGQKAGIHHFQIITTNGTKLSQPPQK
ncbi:MAG TPA: hypothetical protein DDW52_28695 [Planctomycetaceae bacterium]|nr:hypothetical protein [Planctomycetaceae bacterium]